MTSGSREREGVSGRRGWLATSDAGEDRRSCAYGHGNAGHLEKSFWGMVRMETIGEKEVGMRGRREDLQSRLQEGLALDRRRSARLSLMPPGPPGEDAQHPSQVLLLCILIASIIQCGSKFILGKNWLSKLPLFFSKTKKMFIGRKMTYSTPNFTLT